MYYAKVETDGTYTLDSQKPDLAKMQKDVGGLLESVPLMGLPFPIVVMVNEQPEDAPEINFVASNITTVPVRGTAIFFGPVDEDGELTPLSSDMLTIVRGLAQMAMFADKLQNG